MEGEQGQHSIGVVERDTGIGRDTLRVWERRYGFPAPSRNQKGERVYTEYELRHLQRIRRLMDQGLRPGKLLPLAENDLNQLEASLQPASSEANDEVIEALLNAVKSVDAGRIAGLLRSQFEQQGMQNFVLKTLMPLLQTVGESWAQGSLEIFQEHFLSQQVVHFLNVEIARVSSQNQPPQVLLATLPGEEHTLGLLMMSAMLTDKGVTTINLGGEVPMDQIHQAVKHYQTPVVGITFSGAYQYSNIRSHLLELRELLDDDVDIWTGGEGVRRLRKLPQGITKFISLDRLPEIEAVK